MGAGAPFTKVQAFGGINVGAYEGHDIMVDTIGEGGADQEVYCNFLVLDQLINNIS